MEYFEEKIKNYTNEEDTMLGDCEGWDIERNALIEAFQRGIELGMKEEQKKQVKS